MSWFSCVEQGLPIEYYALIEQHAKDSFVQKVLVGSGVYRTDEDKPWVLPVVRAAEKALANDETLDKEYLHVLGIESFSMLSTHMLLGDDSKALAEKRAFGVQTLSGTGALRVGAEFLNRQLRKTVFYYSKPSWGSHWQIFINAGFQDAREYRYWNEATRGLDIDGFLEDLNNAPEGSVIILHACAHNPTGCDPTQEQWSQIAKVIKKTKLFPFFDSAYQGFASGDLDKDAWAVRLFVSQGFEFFCAQSFSKNLGLYNERVGNLSVVMSNPSKIPAVKSQLSLIIRGMYSNPPSHGARIACYVLNNKELSDQWKDNMKTMSSRIIEIRKRLREELEHLGAHGNWNHITDQIGMFSYTGLNHAQSEHMVKKHHIYMYHSGRMSMCGITPTNVEYVAKCIHETLTSLPAK